MPSHTKKEREKRGSGHQSGHTAMRKAVSTPQKSLEKMMTVPSRPTGVKITKDIPMPPNFA